MKQKIKKNDIDKETLIKNIRFVNELYDIIKMDGNKLLMARLKAALMKFRDNGKIDNVSYSMLIQFLNAYYTFYQFDDMPESAFDTVKQVVQSIIDCDNANETLSELEDSLL